MSSLGRKFLFPSSSLIVLTSWHPPPVSRDPGHGTNCGGKHTRRSRKHSLYSHFIWHPEPHILMYIKRPASHNITDNHHVY